jgi:hypothetical protein
VLAGLSFMHSKEHLFASSSEFNFFGAEANICCAVNFS